MEIFKNSGEYLGGYLMIQVVEFYFVYYSYSFPPSYQHVFPQ